MRVQIPYRKTVRRNFVNNIRRCVQPGRAGVAANRLVFKPAGNNTRCIKQAAGRRDKKPGQESKPFLFYNFID